MDNSELIEEARRHPEAGDALRAVNLLNSLADALERSERERDILARGFVEMWGFISSQEQFMMTIMGNGYPAVREALALVEETGDE